MISCLSWIMTDEGVGAEGSCFSRSSDLSIPLPQFFSIVLNFRSQVLTQRHFPNWQFSKSVLALALGPLACSSCNVLQLPPHLQNSLHCLRSRNWDNAFGKVININPIVYNVNYSEKLLMKKLIRYQIIRLNWYYK